MWLLRWHVSVRWHTQFVRSDGLLSGFLQILRAARGRGRVSASGLPQTSLGVDTNRR